jgi:acetyl esterase
MMSDPYVLEETASLIQTLVDLDAQHMAEMEPPHMRAAYLKLGQLFDAPPEASVRSADFTEGSLTFRAYFPAKAEAGPVIVYLHGGGWVIGDLESHHPLCSLIAAETGLRVVSVDYRLAPEHPYPAAHDDCLAAARIVAASPAWLEAPVTGIAVAGDSAGGNLAFHVAREMGADAVIAQLLIYPVTDCTGPNEGSYVEFAEGYLLDRKLMDCFMDHYLPDPAHAREIAASPGLHALPPGLPPAVIVTAGLDPLRDQGRALAAALASGGSEVHFIEAAGMIHGLATMRGAFPSAEPLIRRAAAALAGLMRG